ncbi:ECF transporter S component [Sporomusa termitida]|uniref:Alpha-ribazole transporter n=1 Tax=Sporomusa termitida TaxID=2377 RepID=A0A517DXT1_9FIRM|nr:ECF transporter S component [Sporomusa termitida]QDR82165.1 hypothetical protein SPTER_35860 [Sporomusa termitida]
MDVRANVVTGLLIALSFAGANIKVLGSIAFDSMPGFLGTLLLGAAHGAIIAAAGHFLTALLAGFPLSLLVHIITMGIMAATMAAFGSVYQRFAAGSRFSGPGALLAGLVAVLINGPVGLFILSPLLLPLIGQTGMLSLLPLITGVAALNVLLAVIIYRLLGNVKAKEANDK